MTQTVIICKKAFDPRVLTALFPTAEVCALRGDLTPAILQRYVGYRLVFALPGAALQAAAALCREGGFAEVLVFPYDVRADLREPIPVDVSKPRLDYFETEISETCNLNCRGCCDFCNLLSGKRFYDFDTFCADLARLKSLFWGVEKIRLMGGEPLLNPRLADYVEETRAVFPDSDLRIVSNGLLIPTLSAETLRRIREADCSFDISNYPPTREKRAEIETTLRSAGVQYNLGLSMSVFFRNLRQTPIDDPTPAFRNCIFTHCHMLGPGRIAPCSYAYCAYRFNDRFGPTYPETDYVDLSDPDLDGWEILRRFSMPHDFCRCCGSGIAPIRWKGGCRADAARPEDWQIPSTFFHSRLLPVAQRLVKPAAVKLRAMVQKRHEET